MTAATNGSALGRHRGARRDPDRHLARRSVQVVAAAVSLVLLSAAGWVGTTTAPSTSD